MCYLEYEEDKRARTQAILHRIFAGPAEEVRAMTSITEHKPLQMDMSQQVHGGPLVILEFKRQVTFTERPTSELLSTTCSEVGGGCLLRMATASSWRHYQR